MPTSGSGPGEAGGHKSGLAGFQNGSYYFSVDQGPPEDVNRQKSPVCVFPFPTGGRVQPPPSFARATERT